MTRLLSAAQMERYRDWFANARRIRDLTGELEALSLEIAASTEDWGRGRPPRTRYPAVKKTGPRV